MTARAVPVIRPRGGEERFSVRDLIGLGWRVSPWEARLCQPEVMIKSSGVMVGCGVLGPVPSEKA